MTPPPGAAGGLLNPIMGSLVMTGDRGGARHAARHAGRHLHGEYGRYDKLSSVVRFHQRHSVKRAFDR